MRIAYCTNVRLPSERAHGHQVRSVCDAIARLGHDVTIFSPYRKNPVDTHYHAYYNADPRVKIVYLGTFDSITSPWTPGVLGLWIMNAILRRHLTADRLRDFDLLYTRTPALLPSLIQTNIPVVLELHTLPRRSRRSFVRACNRCARVVCLTSPMRDVLVKWGVAQERVIVEGDAVNLAAFEHAPDRATARRHFDIAGDTFVVGYAGSLTTMGISKGVDTLLNAVQQLRKEGHDIIGLIAGGPPFAVSTLKMAYHDDAHFVGQLLAQDIPTLYAASDVLVYPAPASRHPYFTRDTSPLKVFEYMASGIPMITADLPPLHDVLTNDDTLFVAPGDAQSMKRALLTTMTNQSAARTRATHARNKVAEHTWDKRMQRILSSLS